MALMCRPTSVLRVNVLSHKSHGNRWVGLVLPMYLYVGPGLILVEEEEAAVVVVVAVVAVVVRTCLIGGIVMYVSLRV